MKKEWRYRKVNEKAAKLIDQLLSTRNLKKTELDPMKVKLSAPDAFTDMPKCAKRIAAAIAGKEKIVIHGDFDADGVTSTALLYKTLTALNADISWFIPEREKEGHGLDNKTLVKLMTTVKPKLIITVDCGISDVEAVKFLNSFKIDVIITDHHEAPEVLPDAFGIINPKAPNALDPKLSTKEIKSLTNLAGVGVAFKLAQALLAEHTEVIPELLPLVALGTIADVVPLVGENRYLVARGLQLMNKNPGLKQLLESAGYKDEPTAENVAFGVAPRINASGRLDTVDAALNVLISDNPQEIKIAVQTLNEFNKIRQTLGQEMFSQALTMVEDTPAIILFNPEWHIGIIGITAGRLAEKYNKPAFLLTSTNGQLRCSARSIEGANLYDILSVNSDLLDSFGGHALAAGFACQPDKFEEIKQNLNKTIAELGHEFTPYLDIDLDLQPDKIDMALVDEISKLEPFGASNPPPIFSLKNLIVKEKRLMGENKDHLRLTCQAGDKEFTCVRWSQGDVALEKGDVLDVAFHPQINEYNGAVSLQLVIDDIHSEHFAEAPPPTVKYYDHRKKTGILPQVEDYVKTSKLNVAVFAENKAIVDTLSPALRERVFNRENIPKCDAIMFFDYPADRETFARVVSGVGALHFFAYEPKNFDEKEFLKTAAGMLKFAHNNNAGLVELCRCAGFLGKSYAVFEVLFGIFEQIGLIKIIEKSPKSFKISYNDGVDLTQVLHNERYAGLLDLIDECEAFQKSLMQDELESIL